MFLFFKIKKLLTKLEVTTESEEENDGEANLIILMDPGQYR